MLESAYPHYAGTPPTMGIKPGVSSLWAPMVLLVVAIVIVIIVFLFFRSSYVQYRRCEAKLDQHPSLGLSSHFRSRVSSADKARVLGQYKDLDRAKKNVSERATDKNTL